MGKQSSPDLKKASGDVDLGAADFQFKRGLNAAIICTLGKGDHANHAELTNFG